MAKTEKREKYRKTYSNLEKVSRSAICELEQIQLIEGLVRNDGLTRATARVGVLGGDQDMAI